MPNIMPLALGAGYLSMTLMMPKRASPMVHVTSTLAKRFPLQVRRYRHCNSPASAIPHLHDQHELALCLAGRATIGIDRERHVVTAGDGVLIAANCPHWYESGPDGSEWDILHFRLSTLGTRVGDGLSRDLGSGLLEQGRDARLLGYARDLADELGAERPGRRELAFDLLHALVVLLHRRGGLIAPRTAQRDSLRRLGPALAFIARHHARPLDSGEIAAAVGLGPSQLRRLFLDGLGCTPTAYVRGCRMDSARAC